MSFLLIFENSSWYEKHFCCFLWKISSPLFVYFNSVCSKYASAMGIMFKENPCKTARPWNKVRDNFKRKHSVSNSFYSGVLKKKNLNKTTPNFLLGWHKHCDPEVTSVLLIRSQIILLSHLGCPQILLSVYCTSLLLFLSESYLLRVDFLICG